MSPASSAPPLKDEMRRILTVARSLSNLSAEDLTTLHALADVCMPWADEVATQIHRILEANEATRIYVNTYLDGDPAAWYRGLFQATNIYDFWFRQTILAVGHVRNEVPTEVVVGLAPRWINLLTRRAQHALPPEQAKAFTNAMPRILSSTVTVLVATHELITKRTFMEETGFSPILIQRLRLNTLKTFVRQIQEEMQSLQ